MAVVEMPTPLVARRTASLEMESIRSSLAEASRGAPTVDVVIPVYNEAAGIELSVRCLDAFLARDFPLSTRITVVDNASTDDTWQIAQRLSAELPRVQVLHLAENGRGRALRAAWATSDAAILAYMDVDLSTDLRALLPLVAPLLSGHSDVSIGSRLLPGSRVRRGLKRELISRCYNRLLRTVLHNRFHDAQCGFKALRADAAQRLMGGVQDQGWFFDTELLINAERMGMRIHELPVDWNDDPDSRVNIVATAIADLRGVARLWRARGVAQRGSSTRRMAWRTRRHGRFVRFAAIGAVSTLAYVLLYSLLRTHLAPVPSNGVALVATAIANTEANRRLTFGVHEPARRFRDHIGGLAAFAASLAITTSAAEALTLVGHTSRTVELTVLAAASAVAALTRYIMLGRFLRPPSSKGFQVHAERG
jgi:glycosyltransferase involved in cell wall biosynthesis